SFATIAEVYTLTSLLILVIFLLMFRWRRLFSEASRRPAKPASQEGKSGSSASGDSTGDDRSSLSRPVAWSSTHRYLYAGAFLFGLALGVHHVSVGLMLPALAVLVFKTEGIGFFTSRRLLYAALFAFT